MPFDVAGNFTRSYNFQQDRDNGIKILAARVDGEFDNFATGMNAVFFRDGRVPMQADLRMNINRITGLADGAVGSPAVKFNTDASTGPYLDGLSRYAVSVNGVQRSVSTTTGFDVTGNITATGTISEGGTLLNAKYAPLASPAFTGVPTAPTAAAGTSTTQIASTAFVATSFAKLASPNFTGVPTAPTAPVGSSNLQLATTAFVKSQAYAQLAGAAFTGTVSAATLTVAGAAAALFLNPRDGTSTAIPYAYSPTSGETRFGNGASDIWVLNSNTGTATLNLGIMWVNGVDKLLLQHNNVDGIIRTQPGAGKLILGSNGVNVITVDTDRVTQSLRLECQGRGTFVSPGDGATTGAIRLAADALATPAAYIQITDHAQAAQWSYAKFTSDGKMYWSGALEVQGNITSLSDRRFKSDIRPLESGLALVQALKPVRYIKDGKPDLGLIAQDVEQVIPELVATNQDGIKSLDYGRLSAVLAAGLQALAERMDKAGL